MLIGVPREIKNNENRVAMTPAGVHDLVKNGHSVMIECSAGEGSGFQDLEYIEAGAEIAPTANDIYGHSEMIIKVKEPLESEYDLLHEGQTLFTYLHLAPNRPLTEALISHKVTGIAYETVQLADRSLPLLAPMSEVAGRMSVQVGAYLLQRYNNGRGILLGGVSGVLPADVLIVGGGVVGSNAAKMALGLGARVTIADLNISRLSYLNDIFGGAVSTMIYNEYDIAEQVKKCDLLIGAVLVVGARAPKIVTEKMVMTMKKGSVIVDVAIDQGGSIETIDRITTHDNPYFVKHGVVHYSVANMPGAVARTSTLALTGATLPYIRNLANKGPLKALLDDPALLKGLNTYDGALTYEAVATSMRMPCIVPQFVLSNQFKSV